METGHREKTRRSKNPRGKSAGPKSPAEQLLEEYEQLLEQGARLTLRSSYEAWTQTRLETGEKLAPESLVIVGPGCWPVWPLTPGSTGSDRSGPSRVAGS